MRTKIIIFILGSVVGAGISYCVQQVLHKQTHRGGILTMTNERGGQSVLTSPLLDCEINEDGALQLGLVPFGGELDAYVDGLVRAGKAKTIAVYYRDLNNGPWLGTHEDETFLPASLLKVPVMIAYLKAAETDPEILNKKILFEKEFLPPDGGTQQIVPSETLEVGKEYTALELVERAIIYSDNQATQLLYENIDGKHVFDVYRRIGVSTDSIERPGAVLTPRDYSAFFRILHNASYLSRENSERALALLSRTEHRNGVVAGVPEGTIVSHKFGEAGSSEDLLQYHDCGIVYHPLRHYILCIMTKGTDRGTMVESIQSISKFVWERVDEQTRQ